jgi:hypothetical protein
MDAESKKSYHHGFILKEADLRRLVNLIEDQFNKLSDRPGVGAFRMKFRNGAITENTSLDEVLAQENIGSNQIVRLSYSHNSDEPNPNSVQIEFINADLDDDAGIVSVRFKVFGHDRDWVIITSSLLEERVDKFKRFALNQLFGKGPSKAFVRLLLPLIVVFIPILISIGIPLLTGAHKVTPADKLAEAWKSGTIKDPVEAIIFLEKEKKGFGPQGEPFPIKEVVYFFGSIIVLLLIMAFFLKYYLVYNFLWGEYVEEFNRRESTRRFWLIVIAVGIVVSFVGGILANNIGFWRRN